MRPVLCWLFSLIPLLGACAVNVPGEMDETGDAPAGTVAYDDFGSITNGLASRTAGPADKMPPAPAAADRLLVYRGAMNVEVARVDEAAQAFLTQVQQWGGYLSNQQDRQYTVRLPAAKFEEAMAALRGMGRVLSESRQVDDVTEEMVDLGIRLDNARRARERLLELLAKADKVEDILKVEEQLRRLTEEIERMEGRQKFLADQVAMATLVAAFSPVAAVPDRPGGRPSRFEWIRQVGAERMLGRW